MERPTGVANREDLEQSSRDNSFPLPTLFFMVLARLCRIISLDLCLKRNQEPNSQTLLTRERREGIITNIYGQKIFLQGLIKNVLCGFVRLDLIKDLVSQPLVETLLPFSLPKEIINVHILPCVVGIECLLEDVETLIGYLPNHFIDLDGLNEEMLPAILPIIVRNWHKFTITSRKIVYDIVRFAEPANLKLFAKSSATRQLYFQCVGRLLSMFDVPDVWKEVFDCRLRDLVREYSELQQILDQHFPITLQRSETEEHTKNGVLFLPNLFRSQSAKTRSDYDHVNNDGHKDFTG